MSSVPNDAATDRFFRGARDQPGPEIDRVMEWLGEEESWEDFVERQDVGDIEEMFSDPDFLRRLEAEALSHAQASGEEAA
jgi:hypothetical protein